MLSYIARRLVQLPLLLLFASLIVFSLMHLAPGDPVPLMLGDYADPEAQAALRHELGLDRPLPVQYVNWLWKAAHGDLGFSVANRQDVMGEIAARLPNTLVLAALAMVWAVVIAIPIGIISAVRQNSWADYLSMSFALGGVSIPSFVLALVLIFILSVRLRLFPISGGPAVTRDPVGAIKYLVLPALALGAYACGVIARMLRSCMVEVLHQDYILTARGKGLGRVRIYWRHALKNAFIPTMTVIGINFAYMLGGSVVIEQIFSLPGIGGYLMQAVLGRDFPVIQGISLCVALVFVFVNLATDILYSYLDPRIRYD
jgi:peptide/nickel transport system permease protein